MDVIKGCKDSFDFDSCPGENDLDSNGEKGNCPIHRADTLVSLKSKRLLTI